jgi:hypothetical protein
LVIFVLLIRKLKDMKSIFTSIILLQVLLHSVFGQIQIGEMQNLSNEYGPSREQDIANIGNNYLLVWNNWGDLKFRKSNNGGQNWGEKLTLYTAFDYGANYPVIAASGEKVYVAYYRNTSGNSEVFLVKSENGGQSFGNEIQVTNSIKLAQVPQIQASGDTVVIAYEDRDNDWNYQIFLTYSTDAGATWSEPVNLSNTIENARWCNLAMQGQRLVVMWNDQTGATYNDLDVFFTKSTDFGISWTEPLNITNNGFYNARLNTKIIENSIYTIVSSKVDGLQTDIMLYRSDDFGDNWQPAVNLSDNTGDSERPDVWVTPNFSGNHRIYAVWSDDTYTSNDKAYLKYSADNGYSWSELIPFSNQSEDAAWVQIVGEATGPVDEMYMVWYRPNDGTFVYEVWGVAALNQVSSDVNLSGIISDENDNPIENATVALGGYVVFSDSDGNYSLNVPAGVYDLTVSASGYQNYLQNGVELFENAIINVALSQLVPGNYPPHNLKVKQNGINSIIASWDAPIGFDSQELYYDDGEANGLFWVGTATGNEWMAVAFEHEASCYLRQAKLFTSPGFAGEQMKVYIFGDDGGGPSPEIVLGGPFLVDVGNGWTTLNMDIPIPANIRFYIATIWDSGSDFRIGGDLNQPDGYSYSTSDGGQNWFIHDNMDFMLRAGIAFDGKDELMDIFPKGKKKELSGYQPYVNGEVYGEPITDHHISIPDLQPGETHTFGISAVYNNGASPVTELEIFIPLPLLFPPINLVAEEIQGGDLGILLSWDEPASEGEWLHWDDGINSDAVGGENIEIFDAAIRFTADDLSDFDGQYLTEIAFFVADTDCQLFVRVWQGGNQNYAGNLIREQIVAYPIANEWNVIQLETPVMIDASQELWFGYRVINPNGVYPAGTDGGPAVSFKGDMLLYGSDWVSMSNYFGWDINWNIQGFVVDAGEKFETKLFESIFPEKEILNSGLPQKITFQSTSMPFGREYSNFNIYNQNVLIGTAPSGTYEFLDEEIMMYNVYHVTTAWGDFESAPSNQVIVSYVGMDNQRTEKNDFMVSPNPVKDIINISFEANGDAPVRITVNDILGKEMLTMYDAIPRKGKNEIAINLKNTSGAQPDAGVYFVVLQTAGEVQVAKIVITK